jgi:hypothetical protein
VATSSRCTDRVATYQRLLDEPGCPIKRGDRKRLFFEPYYQLMRQALLAWQMVEYEEHGASAWLHVHVVPELNVTLRGGGRGAKELGGETMAGAPIAHAGLHTTAVLHSYETETFLPPHR